MNVLHTRWRALVLALLLAVSLAVPAAAAETETAAEDLQTLADTAASYAAQYGGAQSLQYALWQDGEIVLTGEAGTFSRSENRLMTGDELYGIGSVSKIYTTVAVMQLAEDGKVSLDAPMTQYLPDFKMADERYKDITVRMLLNHSSGILGTGLSDAMLFGEASTRAHDTLLEKLSTQRLAADPGAFSVYCNDGFTLAELVVEAVSGMDFDAYVRQAILEPAGLEDTWFPGEDFDQSLLAKTYLTAEDTRALPNETVGIHGTGGIYASASDLAAFGGQVWCTDAVLNQESRTAALADEYARGLWPEDDEDVVSYGLGWDSVHWYPFAYSGIQAAAKGIQLDQVKILPCFYKACGSIKPGMIHPLVIDADRTLNVCQMGNGILCENSKSVAVNKIRDTVMDFRVNMVRTPCQDNAPAPCFFQVFQSFFTLFLNISAGSGQFFPGSVSSSFYFLSRQIFKNFYKAVSKHRF